MDYRQAIIFIIIVSFVAYRIYRKKMRNRRGYLIDTFQFPETISQKIIERYPHLSAQQTLLVMDGLRDYFHVCNLAGKKMVSMPSQVVDVAWHEFILFTKQYENFCQKALGQFLHHTPAEAMHSPTVAQSGIKTAWKICCQRENLTPGSPTRLPLLFALDNKLEIPDGFNYALDCTTLGTGDYCATHIGCTGSGSGSTSGCGGDSSGCGGD